MEENRIELKYDKLVTNLTGNKLGRREYKKQIESNLEYDKMNIIVFPDQIDDVGMSFFQGLCQELLNRFGRKNVKEYIRVQSIHSEIVQKFDKILEI